MIVKLRDIGTIVTGNTPKTSEKENYISKDIPFVKPSDISDDEITYLTESEFYISEYARSKARILPPNSVLFTCIGIIGKVAINENECAFNQQINAIIPNNKFNSNYIYYLMEYISPYLQSIAGTSATAIVNKETFERVKVKVHILEEQKKIDSLLSYIETKIILEDKLLNNLKQLKKGLMQNMFV